MFGPQAQPFHNSKPRHPKQSPFIPTIVEGEDDFFGDGAEVFGLFLGRLVLAEDAGDLSDAVGGAGFADDEEDLL
jgi:hypothetical protein